MKKLLNLKLLAIALACLFSALSASAASDYDFSASGFAFKIVSQTIYEAKVEVTYWDDVDYFDVNGAYYYDDETIPSTVSYNGVQYTVTGIGDDAFHGCYRLTSITIPETVTYIGDRAFDGCSDLTVVNLGDRVSRIGTEAFYNCSSLSVIYSSNPNPPTIDSNTFRGLYYYDITIYVLPSAVSSYENSSWDLGFNITSLSATYYGITYAVISNSTVEVTHADFYSSATEMNLPSTVTISGKSYTVVSIGDDAAKNKQYLYYATLPNTITRIGARAFAGSGIKKITIPNSVTSLGVSAFMGCTSLSSLTLSTSLTDFYEDEFNGCTSLTTVTIPSSVKSIGWGTFEGCTALKNVTIPSSVTRIFPSAFRGCTSLTSMTLPNSVIDWSGASTMFENCTSLQSVSLPSSMNVIPSGMFKGCTMLNNITIPSGVTTIGQNAFNGCSSLPWTLSIPNSVTSIGGYAFYNCTTINALNLGNSISSIGDYAFYNCPLTYITVQVSTPPTIYANTFNGNYSTGWVYVPKPQDVTTYKATDYWKKFAYYNSISPWDFNYNGLYYIITGSNTASVTYRDTESLTYSGDVFVPKTVTYNSVTYNVTGINYGAFGDMRPDNIRGEGTPNLTANTALYSVVIGDNVTTLGGLVFDKCTAMHTVDFGPAVTSIGSGSFNQCTALKSVVSRSTTPPTFQSGSYLNGFANYSGTLYVPSSAVNAYKAATYWKNFASVRALPTLNEALNVSGGNITFTSTGDNFWKSMVYNGSFYAMSGNDGAHNSTSTLTATVTVPTGGATLSFDFKAWGEGAGYDKCMFLLDGTIKFNYGARQNDWETYNVELSAGTHTLAWTYSKDGSVNPVGDYFAVANVKVVKNAVETGDVNGDSNVTIADVTALIDLLLSSGSVDNPACDVNGDGNVTIADVTALIDLLLSGN